MAIKAFDAKHTFPYSLKEDTDPKTVFIIGALDSKLKASLSNDLIDNKDNRVRAGTQIRDTVKFGLKGWENLLDSEGNPIPFDEKAHLQSHGTQVGSYKGLTDRALDLLSWSTIEELFNVILKGNTLSEQDEKNSETPSA